MSRKIGRVENLSDDEIAAIEAAEVQTDQPYNLDEEMSEIYADLMDTDELTVAEIARMLGRPEAWVEHVLKLVHLPSRLRPDVDEFVEDQRRRDAALREIGDHTDEWGG